MAYIFVDTGQCGNQLGCSILDSLYKHLESNPLELSAFFRHGHNKEDRKWYARAVCIDTEPKVVNSFIDNHRFKKKNWLFDVKGIVYRHGGAGNNWAMGYQMLSGDFLDTSLDCIRNELERCNRPPTLVVTQSVAGGTGSGCGTRLTEAITDEFPDVTRLNTVVTPYHFGEVVVQHYNSILSLSKISEVSDAILIFENQIAHQLCREMIDIERPTLHDINDVITANIVPILLPKYRFPIEHIDTSVSSTSTVSSSSFINREGTTRSVPITISDDIVNLCCHPGYKFLNIRNVPQTSKRSIEFTFDSWKAMLNNLRAMTASGSSSERGISAYVNHFRQNQRQLFNDDNSLLPQSSISKTKNMESDVLMRNEKDTSEIYNLDNGKTRDKITTVDDHGNRKKAINRHSLTSNDHFDTVKCLKSILIFRGNDAKEGLTAVKDPTVPFHDTVLNINEEDCYYSSHTVNGYQRSTGVLSNSQAVLPVLNRAVDKGVALYRVGAFLHQYQAWGTEDGDFVDAFRTLGQVIQNYQSLS